MCVEWRYSGVDMVRMLWKESTGHTHGHLILGVKLRKGLGRRQEAKGESGKMKPEMTVMLSLNCPWKR